MHPPIHLSFIHNHHIPTTSIINHHRRSTVHRSTATLTETQGGGVGSCLTGGLVHWTRVAEELAGVVLVETLAALCARLVDDIIHVAGWTATCQFNNRDHGGRSTAQRISLSTCLHNHIAVVSVPRSQPREGMWTSPDILFFLVQLSGLM